MTDWQKGAIWLAVFATLGALAGGWRGAAAILGIVVLGVLIVGFQFVMLAGVVRLFELGATLRRRWQ